MESGAVYKRDVDQSIEPMFEHGGQWCQAEDNSLFGIGGSMYDAMHIKIAFLLFLVFCIINTDVFAEHVLGRLSKKNYDRVQDKISERGILIGGVFMSVSYLIVDLMVSRGLV